MSDLGTENFSQRVQSTRFSAKTWKECKLGDVAEIKGGKRLPKGEILTTIKTPYPYIRITDFDKHKIDLSAIQYVTEEVQKTISRYIVSEEDIIISVVGTIGLCAKIPKSLDGANLTENCVKLIFDKNLIDTNFLFYQLISPDMQELISSLDVGSTQPKLPIYNIQKIDIFLPPLEEQKAIAEILTSLDDKIDLLYRQNKTLEELAQTIFRQWFIDGNEILISSWKICKLSDEFDFTMGLSPSGSTYNEEKNGMPMFQENADFEFRFPKNRVYTTDPKRIAEKFDTLISVRAPVGAQNMAKERCCIGRGVASFRYKFDNSFYTYTYYKMHSLMEEIKQFNETGTVFGSIGKSDFEDIEIIKPPFEYVAKFQNEVKPIDDKIILNSEQIQTLENLRDTLLPKLLSGEIRLRLNKNTQGYK